MIAKVLIFLACLLPLGAKAWSWDGPNDQTHSGLGGRYGIYQLLHVRSDAPAEVYSTWVCLGLTSVCVPAINWRVKDPRFTGLRELWASQPYSTNALPAIWTPRKSPPTTRDLGSFLQFNLQKDGSSILSFIERYGLPTRYLTGYPSAEITEGTDGPQFSSGPLQGQDFLVYDLPTGHTVALYVPKSPANEFTTAVIIDLKGNLLILNMVQVVLPRIDAPRKLTAQPDSKITAANVNGGKTEVGSWTMRNGELIAIPLGKADDALRHNSIWLGNVEYFTTYIHVFGADDAGKVNSYEEFICGPVRKRLGTSPEGR